MLTLSEELFLLSLHEKKDGVGLSARMELPYAQAGALLLELCLAGQVRLEGKKVVAVGGAGSSSGEMQNELLTKMTATKKPRKIGDWIMEFGAKEKKLRKISLASLVQHGMLREEEKNFLWVIPYTGYSSQDTSAKFALKAQLRDVVLGGKQVDEHSVALLSLVRVCGLLDNLFTRDELRLAKKRVDELVKDETIGKAVQETIDAINSAVSTAVIVATSSNS